MFISSDDATDLIGRDTLRFKFFQRTLGVPAANFSSDFQNGLVLGLNVIEEAVGLL